MFVSIAFALSLSAPAHDAPVLGTGGPESELFQGRLDKRDKERFTRREGGAKTSKALAAALKWLASKQGKNGGWSVVKSEGVEVSNQSQFYGIGLTGLALLAFLGDGHTPVQGEYKETVQRGLKWLLENQDDKTGLFGVRNHHGFLYNHAVATLAVAEAYSMDDSRDLEAPLEKACKLILLGRNEEAAWRYNVPAVGDNDTCISAWCGLALAISDEAGIPVDPAAFEGLEAWLDKATDAETGRVGYDSAGSRSARLPNINNDFSPEHGEAMTAVAMTVRSFTMRRRLDKKLWQKQTELLLKQLPAWEVENKEIDMYYWYFATQAMFQVGGKGWKAWNKATKEVILDSQLKEGPDEGAWAPVGAWGAMAGQVYSTALMAMSLEVYYRYPRMLDQ